MKIATILTAAFLSLALGRAACAQTTTSGAAAQQPGSLAQPGGIISTIPPNAVSPNATTPTDAQGAIYSNGVPARNTNGGTQRADQPRMGDTRMPAVNGSQQPYRIHKGRPSKKNQPVD
jgi:hypothetical protein